MNELRIGKVVTYAERIVYTERIVSDGLTPSCTKAWAAAVVECDFAAGRAPAFSALSAMGAELGHTLGQHAWAALGWRSGQSLSYGKGAIVGSGCEIEQAAAILHPRLGEPLRARLGRGRAIIPSTVKHGGPGSHLDVPLHGADDEWDFSLLDAMEACVPGAPRSTQIVVVIALAAGGRPFAHPENRRPS